MENIIYKTSKTLPFDTFKSKCFKNSIYSEKNERVLMCRLSSSVHPTQNFIPNLSAQNFISSSNRNTSPPPFPPIFKEVPPHPPSHLS